MVIKNTGKFQKIARCFFILKKINFMLEIGFKI